MTQGFYCAIVKKGGKNRGISIESCFGKLFTSILNNRILTWERDHNILTCVRFGFRSGLSTVDAIFVIQGIFNRIYVKTNVYTFALLIFKSI